MPYMTRSYHIFLSERVKKCQFWAPQCKLSHSQNKLARSTFLCLDFSLDMVLCIPHQKSAPESFIWEPDGIPIEIRFMWRRRHTRRICLRRDFRGAYTI